MHNREADEQPDVSREPVDVPALFTLEAVYKGQRRVVAEGTAFLDPEQVVLNWRSSSAVEVIDSVDELYEKVGGHPRIMWRHDDEDILTEVEPDRVVEHTGE